MSDDKSDRDITALTEIALALLTNWNRGISHVGLDRIGVAINAAACALWRGPRDNDERLAMDAAAVRVIGVVARAREVEGES